MMWQSKVKMLMCQMTWQLMWPRVDVELHDDDMRPELCEACEKAVSLVRVACETHVDERPNLLASQSFDRGEITRVG